MSKKDNLQEADGNKEINIENVSQETSEASTEIITSEAETTLEEPKEDSKPKKEEEVTKKADAHVEEIDESNAEDAEDESNSERHTLETKDYHAMPMDLLVLEFEKLLKNHDFVDTVCSG